jgi:FixJ family two-component response regulator
MKTKLTLNIDDATVKKVRLLSKRRKQSISSIIEDFLNKITNENHEISKKNTETFTENFRKLFPSKPVKNYDYKKIINEHRDKKYGS